jgi:uncharacterized protein (DUF433 family)
VVYDVDKHEEKMSRYALNLPQELKREAEEMAANQGISLNQFIMWSVSEKVSSLRQSLDDPNFPAITYRKGASGWVQPVLRGTGIRVQTIAMELKSGVTVQKIAEDYKIGLQTIKEALSFYEVHKVEIDASILSEQKLAEQIDQAMSAS